MKSVVTRVCGVRHVGPDAIALDIETPEGFDARPGQFVKLSLDIDGESRSRFYTLSSPAVGDTFEITVGIDPEGDVGPHLAALTAGETVEISGPFGDSYYDGERRVVILAGGPGIGPAVGIAERALDEGHEAAVVYRDDDPIHEARLDDLREAGASVVVLDERESLHEAVEAVTSGVPDEQAFVYGFAEFLDAATDALRAAGDDPDRAKTENFG